MKKISKTLILALISLSLLWAFHSSKASNLPAFQSKIAFESDQESDAEGEDLKFSNREFITILPLVYSPQIMQSHDHYSVAQFFLTVPTSPPNC